MNGFFSILGTLIIAVTVRDVFHQLVHPQGRGSISSVIMKRVWIWFRWVSKYKSKYLALAGPIAFASVMLSWFSLLSVGWALIYFPQLPEGFNLSAGMESDANSGFLDALYLSVVSLTTLGYGDIAPKSTILRLLAPLQALVGFALLSAGITWLLSVYPTLTRERSLAQQIFALRRNLPASKSSLQEQSLLPGILIELARRLAVQRTELMQFPISYYFHTHDLKSSLPAALPGLLLLTHECSEADPTELSFASKVLENAIQEFAETVGDIYLGTSEGTAENLLRKYREDHMVPES